MHDHWGLRLIVSVIVVSARTRRAWIVCSTSLSDCASPAIFAVLPSPPSSSTLSQVVILWASEQVWELLLLLLIICRGSVRLLLLLGEPIPLRRHREVMLSPHVFQVVLRLSTLSIVAESRAGEVIRGDSRVYFLIAVVKLLVLVSHSPLLIITTASIRIREHLRMPDLHQSSSKFYKIYFF